MKRLIPYFLFYRIYAVWFLSITTILAFGGFHYLAISLSKLLLILLLWHWLESYPSKKAINYIVRQDLATSLFFGVVYLIDCVITIPFLIILKEFI